MDNTNVTGNYQRCEHCNAELTEEDKLNSECHCLVCRVNNVPYSHKEYKTLTYHWARDSYKVFAVCDFVEIGLTHSRAKLYIKGSYITTIYTNNSEFVENK